MLDCNVVILLFKLDKQPRIRQAEIKYVETISAQNTHVSRDQKLCNEIECILGISDAI